MQQDSDRLQMQINALKNVLKNCKNEKQSYAIKGKIAKLEKTKESKKHFEWLAQ